MPVNGKQIYWRLCLPSADRTAEVVPEGMHQLDKSNSRWARWISPRTVRRALLLELGLALCKQLLVLPHCMRQALVRFCSLFQRSLPACYVLQCQGESDRTSWTLCSHPMRLTMHFATQPKERSPHLCGAAYLIFLCLTPRPPCCTGRMKAAGALPHFRAPSLWGHQRAGLCDPTAKMKRSCKVCLCKK